MNYLTKVVELDENKYNSTRGLRNQTLMRKTPLKEWLSTNELADSLSGTLRKNARIGFLHSGQLYHEALCQTLGWGFESVVASKITFGDAITEGDCHAITETGWHADRMFRNWVFEEDVFELKYICIHTEESGSERQGLAMILKETSVQWIKGGNIVFAMIAEYNPVTKEWTEATNPF